MFLSADISRNRTWSKSSEEVDLLHSSLFSLHLPQRYPHYNNKSNPMEQNLAESHQSSEAPAQHIAFAFVCAFETRSID